MTVIAVENNCGSPTAAAGKRVRIDVKVNGVSIGSVSYEHLDAVAVSLNDSVSNGTVLGKTKKWAYDSGCWEVSTDAGVHTHMSFRGNTCYVNYTNSQSLTSSAAIGVLGTSNTGTQVQCGSVPQPDSDGDGVYDDTDQCPNQAGPAPTGCPVTDSDGDGVLNTSDTCPAVYGKSYNRGCRLDGHTVTGNFVGNDGYTDSVTFYDYTASNLGAFLSTGSSNGLSQPQYLWSTGTGQWSWGNSYFVAGNFAGNDNWTDVIGFYNYGTSKLGAFLFQGNGNGVGQMQHLWTTPDNTFGMGAAKYVVGNFVGNDGDDDVMAFYGYGGANMGIFVFAGNGSGIDREQKQWETGTGQWNVKSAEFVAGNFAGNDNLTDVVALYGYSGSDAAAFLLQGTSGNISQPQYLWSTGTGQWNVANGQYMAGDFYGSDGLTDIAVLYDYGSSNTGMFVYPGNGSGIDREQKQWETGTGQWNYTRVKAFAGDFGGSSTGIFAFYNYDFSNTGGYLLPAATVGVSQPQLKWTTGNGAWNWHAM